MNVLIFGGCGFLGKQLAYALLKLNHNVTIFDHLSIPTQQCIVSDGYQLAMMMLWLIRVPCLEYRAVIGYQIIEFFQQGSITCNFIEHFEKQKRTYCLVMT